MGGVSERYLVTGATGFVGANLARRLVAEGHEVHLLTRSTSILWRLADVTPLPRCHVADVTDKDALSAVVATVKPDVVFHLANAGVYGGTHSAATELFRVNLLGTINLLEACERVPYRCFVNTGSSSEYGIKTEPMCESDSCDPANAYGVSKCASTMYARFVALEQARPIVNLRLFSPFGPFDDPRRLIPYVISRALAGEELLLANPSSVRDFIYIDDVVDAFLACVVRANKLAGEVLNVGSGRQTTVQEVVATVLDITGARSRVDWHAQQPRPWESPFWQADIGKISRVLDWQPRHSVRAGLAKTVAWLQAHPQLHKEYR